MNSIYLLILSCFLFIRSGSGTIKNGVTDATTAYPAEVLKAPDSAFQPTSVNPDTTPATPSVKPQGIKVKTFLNKTGDAANGTWGYDIYMDGKLYVHQPSIPAVAGIKGFKNEHDARKAGTFVTYKIKHNILPPRVTPEELDSIGVLH